MNAVAEGFNTFFVTVGPNLAGEMIAPDGGSAEQFYGARNSES